MLCHLCLALLRHPGQVRLRENDARESEAQEPRIVPFFADGHVGTRHEDGTLDEERGILELQSARDTGNWAYCHGTAPGMNSVADENCRGCIVLHVESKKSRLPLR